MAANALIQARIDAAIKSQASAVLETMGLTISDAVRILLTRVAREGALPMGFTSDEETYDAWFRAKVQAALDDMRPAVADEVVEAQFAARRSAALASPKAAQKG
jgi:DNA-damage-inducible protein J